MASDEELRVRMEAVRKRRAEMMKTLVVVPAAVDACRSNGQEGYDRNQQIMVVQPPPSDPTARSVMGRGGDIGYWKVGGWKRQVRYWTCVPMREICVERARKQGLDLTNPAIKGAMREYYQKRADRGEVVGPTRWELWVRGIDVSTWNGGDGTFTPTNEPRNPAQHPELKAFPDKKYEVKDTGEVWCDGARLVETPLMRGEVQAAPAIPAKALAMIKEDGSAWDNEHGVGARPALYEAVKNIAETGNVLRRKAGRPRGEGARGDDDKPEPTGRRWRGEHYDPTTMRFESPPAAGEHRSISYVNWYQTFLGHPDYPLGKCHEEWGAILEKSKHSINKKPRDHLKTYFYTIGYSLYQILENPDIIATRGILIICWDVGLAEESFLAVKQMLTENPKILEFYGYIIDEKRTCTKEKMFFTYQAPSAKNPGFFCSCLKGGHITGTHPSIVFIDDPQDEPLEESMMRKFRNIINKKIIPAVGKEGRIVVTGTTKGWNRDNDVYIWLESKRMFQVYSDMAEVHGRMPKWEDVKYELKEQPKLGLDGKPMFKVDGTPETEIAYVVTWIKDEETYQTLYPERYSIKDLVIKRLEIRDDKSKSDDDFWSEYFLQARNPLGTLFQLARIFTTLPAGLQQPCTSWKAFRDYCQQFHHSVIAWLDPGGETGHGVAIAVLACIKHAMTEQYAILDLKLVKAPLPEVAHQLAILMEKWGIDRWGCEGNFEQKEAYAHTIDRELYRELEKKGALRYYHSCLVKNNTGDKLQRISSRFSMMLGSVVDPPRVHVNPEAESLEDFMNQARMFGTPLTKKDNHEFDLLDAVVCGDIHMLGSGRPFAIVAG